MIIRKRKQSTVVPPRTPESAANTDATELQRRVAAVLRVDPADVTPPVQTQTVAPRGQR
jgi:hypothetical protein